MANRISVTDVELIGGSREGTPSFECTVRVDGGDWCRVYDEGHGHLDFGDTDSGDVLLLVEACREDLRNSTEVVQISKKIAVKRSDFAEGTGVLELVIHNLVYPILKEARS